MRFSIIFLRQRWIVVDSGDGLSESDRRQLGQAAGGMVKNRSCWARCRKRKHRLAVFSPFGVFRFLRLHSSAQKEGPFWAVGGGGSGWLRLRLICELMQISLCVVWKVGSYIYFTWMFSQRDWSSLQWGSGCWFKQHYIYYNDILFCIIADIV